MYFEHIRKGVEINQALAVPFQEGPQEVTCFLFSERIFCLLDKGLAKKFSAHYILFLSRSVY
jgi:hypothetical protein